MRFRTKVIVAALSGIVLSAPVAAHSYTAVDTGTLGGAATVGPAINATGQVTGYSYLRTVQTMHLSLKLTAGKFPTLAFSRAGVQALAWASQILRKKV